MSRYLNEIRLGNEKELFREIIRDTRREFSIHRNRRTVPHITLFGPYDTQQGTIVKHRKQDLLSKYNYVRYRVGGFDMFPQAGVVYASVEPSQEMRSLRRELARALIPVTYDYQEWDEDSSYDFHITIAMGQKNRCHEILEYVRSNHDVDFEGYAKRMTALDNRKMMWEWDIPRGVELSAGEATSKRSWELTNAALPNDERRKRDSSLFSRIIPWRV